MKWAYRWSEWLQVQAEEGERAGALCGGAEGHNLQPPRLSCALTPSEVPLCQQKGGKTSPGRLALSPPPASANSKGQGRPTHSHPVAGAASTCATTPHSSLPQAQGHGRRGKREHEGSRRPCGGMRGSGEMDGAGFRAALPVKQRGQRVSTTPAPPRRDSPRPAMSLRHHGAP